MTRSSAKGDRLTDRITRRRVLSAGAGSALAGVAGCLGATGDDTNHGTLSAFTSFFTLAEFTRAVGGDRLAVENPVETGGHGHEWSPSGDLLPSVVDADAFVYLDIEGFQPWAERVAERVASDHPDVQLIDALDGIELRRYDAHDHDSDDQDHNHAHDHDHDDHDDHSHDHDDHDHEDHDDHDHNRDEHDHGTYDAKFFTDPVLAREGVRNVRDGLIAVDPAGEDRYRENADAFIDRLETLHEQYERRLADREHDVVVLAGHDSFGYLADRYGFEIHTPVGLSPDHEPTPDRLARAIDLVESEGIDHVLWDYFDGPHAAELIAEEADHEVETAMVSPAESTTEAWLEEGIGSYLEQLESITLPSFERALGATDA